MAETRLKISGNGRVVIPASFREALGIKPGDELVVRIQDDELRITTLRNRLQRARRLVRKYVSPDRSLVEELIAERRTAARKE